MSILAGGGRTTTKSVYRVRLGVGHRYEGERRERQGWGILSDAEQREGGGTETGCALGRLGDGGHRNVAA